VRKYFLILLSLLLLVGAFRGGLEVGERAWAEKVAVETNHAQLSNIRGCLFAIDSDTLHFVRSPGGESLKRLFWRFNQCNSFLEALGTTELDENVSGILGEVQLFLNGYTVTLKEIVGRQIMLETLYNDLGVGDTEKLREVQKLETLQTEQLQEAEKFMDRMQLLITEAW